MTDEPSQPARPSPNRTAAIIGAYVLAGLVIVAGAVLLAIRLLNPSSSTPAASPTSASHSASATPTLSPTASPTPSPGTGLDDSMRGVLATATTYAEQFATYDYQHLTQDFQRTEAHAVNPFLDQYTSETAQIAPSLRKLHSQSSGKVISAGVVSITPTTAVIDMFLDQTISNSHTKQPRVDPQRVTMTLVRQGGRWVISQVVLP